MLTWSGRGRQEQGRQAHTPTPTQPGWHCQGGLRGANSGPSHQGLEMDVHIKPSSPRYCLPPSGPVAHLVSRGSSFFSWKWPISLRSKAIQLCGSARVSGCGLGQGPTHPLPLICPSCSAVTTKASGDMCDSGVASPSWEGSCPSAHPALPQWHTLGWILAPSSGQHPPASLAPATSQGLGKIVSASCQS